MNKNHIKLMSSISVVYGIEVIKSALYLTSHGKTTDCFLEPFKPPSLIPFSVFAKALTLECSKKIMQETDSEIFAISSGIVCSFPIYTAAYIANFFLLPLLPKFFDNAVYYVKMFPYNLFANAIETGVIGYIHHHFKDNDVQSELQSHTEEPLAMLA